NRPGPYQSSWPDRTGPVKAERSEPQGSLDGWTGWPTLHRGAGAWLPASAPVGLAWAFAAVVGQPATRRSTEVRNGSTLGHPDAGESSRCSPPDSASVFWGSETRAARASPYCPGLPGAHVAD